MQGHCSRSCTRHAVVHASGRALAPRTQILQALKMGQTNVALVTFERLKVPRYVRFYSAELCCYPHRPRQLVCKICHRLGHWADHCPTPHVVICATCGTDNPAPSHPCTPHCRSCDRSHPTSDPNCPRRARQTPNKAWRIYYFQRCGNDWTLTSLDLGDTASAFEVPLEIPSQIQDPFQVSVLIPRSITHPHNNPADQRLCQGGPGPHGDAENLGAENAHTGTSGEIARLRRNMEARCEHLQKQMDALVADMGASMQAALDRIERQMEDLRIGITERVELCIEHTLARNSNMQTPEPSSYSASLPPDHISRLQHSNVGNSNGGNQRAHPYTRPSASSRDDDGTA
ncbi:hypothetical protein HPB52_000370 [Rhipicephalus sanguineus]|uniref:CCHC-type domain-containing protein n=1 Tax=Rhipicephalus sanguineus TaxID=34632 RepID=A0A9D4PT91_RHISA|nr:hypothetical protein HPB52_000370 [Rhipicephalus sanguineus]